VALYWVLCFNTLFLSSREREESLLSTLQLADYSEVSEEERGRLACQVTQTSVAII